MEKILLNQKYKVKLKKNTRQIKVGFIFSGQSQVLPLYNNVIFKDKLFLNLLSEVKVIFSKYTLNYDKLFENNENGDNRSFLYKNILLFIIQFWQVKKLKSIGIYPKNVLGHSFGEYAAVATCFDLKFIDILELVVLREVLSPAQHSLGYMLAIKSNEKVLRILNENNDLEIANYNSSFQVVISVKKDQLRNVINYLKKHKISYLELTNVPHPYHSVLMNEVSEKLINKIKILNLENHKTNKIQFITSLGDCINEKENFDYLLYLCEQVTRKVYFDDQIKLSSKLNDILIEIGPSNTFSTIISSISTISTFQAKNILHIKKEKVKVTNINPKIASAIKKIISKYSSYEIHSINMSDNLQEEFGIDSLRKMEIAVQVLDELDISYTDTTPLIFSTPKELAAWIEFNNQNEPKQTNDTSWDLLYAEVNNRTIKHPNIKQLVESLRLNKINDYNHSALMSISYENNESYLNETCPNYSLSNIKKVLSDKFKFSDLAIIGASRGIGEFIKNEAINDKYHNILCGSRNINCSIHNSIVQYNSIDVTSKIDVKKFIKEINVKKIKTLLFCAGYEKSMKYPEYDTNTIDLIYNVKIKGIKNILEEIKKQQINDIQIVFFSSFVSIWGNHSQSIYSMTNHMMNMICENNQNSLKNYNVVIKCILWPAWNNIGMTSDNVTKLALANSEMTLLNRNDGLTLLKKILNDKNGSLYLPMNLNMLTFLELRLSKIINFINNKNNEIVITKLNKDKYFYNIDDHIIKEEKILPSNFFVRIVLCIFRLFPNKIYNFTFHQFCSLSQNSINILISFKKVKEDISISFISKSIKLCSCIVRNVDISEELHLTDKLEQIDSPSRKMKLNEIYEIIPLGKSFHILDSITYNARGFHATLFFSNQNKIIDEIIEACYHAYAIWLNFNHKKTFYVPSIINEIKYNNISACKYIRIYGVVYNKNSDLFSEIQLVNSQSHQRIGRIGVLRMKSLEAK